MNRYNQPQIAVGEKELISCESLEDRAKREKNEMNRLDDIRTAANFILDAHGPDESDEYRAIFCIIGRTSHQLKRVCEKYDKTIKLMEDKESKA